MYKKILVFIIVLLLIATIVYLCMPKRSKNTEIDEKSALINSDNNITNEEINDQIIGTLKIEKINLEAPIKEGSNSEVLKSFIGHIEDTAIYDGNVGLAAHNRGNQYSFFSRLNELVEGDIVVYETPYGDRNYQVNTISVILETDWQLLSNTKENKLTMITCIKNRLSQRLCVCATQI